MTLHLHSLSGSPFGWKVQFALEHKGLAHDVTWLSADRGDLGQPSLRALNPHGKLPVLADDDFVLFESDAIVDYIEDAFGETGPSLWPAGRRARGIARRVVLEASAYLYPPTRVLVMTLLGGQGDGEPLVRSIDQVSAQLAAFAPLISDGFLNGAGPGAADYAVYPLVALLKRADAKRPAHAVAAAIPPAVMAWSERIERLPFFARTYPPHWRA